MKTAENLLNQLGIVNCTERHLQIVNNFLDSKDTNIKILLDQLGEWTQKDLKIVESFLKTN
jgi:hypothetical protein